ncbi:TonB-dependent receptor [Rhizorhabdus sp.]|uniref:TonB-dependent receptor n=1 Tax=Rhizorhabdus sp. TaxID=1968843 RepID=UPI0019C03D0D|nr:TonB-dependent receptor [Rhizorhabdus sp.]MBD3759324.1 TonB-dependent receptor [Rhizorhabdus sp.]
MTAQKRSERLQDVPIAVTAISGEALSAKGVASTLDIQQVTPGLTFTTTGGTAAPRIRGVGAGQAIAGNEPSVATYVDGVYYASSAGSVMQLANIAQVAVLKGPQGTLFGRNATGGLLQITTLDPKHVFSGKVSASYGNKDTIGASAYVTGGLSDNVAADLSLYYNNQRDGFGVNRFNGQDVGNSRDYSIRSKWLIDIGEDTSIKLLGDYSETKGDTVTRRLITGSLPQIGTVFTGNPFDVDSNTQPFFRSRRAGISGELVHHFDAFDFSSITAYRRTRSLISFDGDGTRINNFATIDEDLLDRQFSQELQLTSTSGGRFQWTAGAYYFYGNSPIPGLTITQAPAVVPPPTLALNIKLGQRTKAPAVYAQGTYKLTDTTSLTLGARYSWETRYYHGSATSSLNGAPPAALPPVTGITKLSNSRPTWRIALDHHVTQDILIYASYNRGFKSGGFATTVFTGPTQTFDPEVLDAYELGFKSELFDRHLRLNASAFHYDYKNIQIQAFSAGPIPVVLNAASAKITGIDLELTMRPTSALTLTTGFSYIHSRFGSFNNSTISVPRVNAAGVPIGGNVTTRGSATGNRLPTTPDWTIDLGADYDVPLGNGGLTLSGHYFHSDGWFAEPDNYLKQKPYDQLSGSISYYFNSEKTITVTAWGRNLTNEAVAVQMQARTTGNLVQIGQGRTFGATLGYKF